MLSGGCLRRHRRYRSALPAVPVNNTRIRPAWMARQTWWLRSVSADSDARAPGYSGCLATVRTRLHSLPLEPAPLALRQPAPDTEPLIVAEGILEALRAHLAAAAHPLGLAGGAALLWKERLRIGLRAQRPVLPALLLGIVCADPKLAHQRDDDICHGAPPAVRSP